MALDRAREKAATERSGRRARLAAAKPSGSWRSTWREEPDRPHETGSVWPASLETWFGLEILGHSVWIHTRVCAPPGSVGELQFVTVRLRISW